MAASTELGDPISRTGYNVPESHPIAGVLARIYQGVDDLPVYVLEYGERVTETQRRVLDSWVRRPLAERVFKDLAELLGEKGLERPVFERIVAKDGTTTWVRFIYDRDVATEAARTAARVEEMKNGVLNNDPAIEELLTTFRAADGAAVTEILALQQQIEAADEADRGPLALRQGELRAGVAKARAGREQQVQELGRSILPKRLEEATERLHELSGRLFRFEPVSTEAVLATMHADMVVTPDATRSGLYL